MKLGIQGDFNPQGVVVVSHFIIIKFRYKITLLCFKWWLHGVTLFISRKDMHILISTALLDRFISIYFIFKYSLRERRERSFSTCISKGSFLSFWFVFLCFVCIVTLRSLLAYMYGRPWNSSDICMKVLALRSIKQQTIGKRIEHIIVSFFWWQVVISDSVRISLTVMCIVCFLALSCIHFWMKCPALTITCLGDNADMNQSQLIFWLVFMTNDPISQACNWVLLRFSLHLVVIISRSCTMYMTRPTNMNTC